MNAHHSRTAEIRAVAAQDAERAQAMLSDLLGDLFGIDPRNLKINFDQYSLNSLNGFFETEAGDFFFKFHQEEGEEAMSGEYYRADILARASLPVDQAVHMSALPGEQILVYRRRHDPRFSDVLRSLDLKDDAEGRRQAVTAEATLSAQVQSVYEQTLHPITPDQAKNEPINRLFYERLVEPTSGAYPGGRLRSFYLDKRFSFPGVDLDWHQLAGANFVINGTRYAHTIGELFDAAHTRLNPALLDDAGGVVAHGDAHNANVWYTHTSSGGELSFFDPAFAGEHVPTLLAEVKTTFHNVLAHPFWLYDPDEAARRFTATARYVDGVLHVETDWCLTPVRQDLLRLKAEQTWRPLLQLLRERDLLPTDWRRVIRLALFLCPTLVMNLRAGVSRHNPVSSLIGFSNAVRAGSEPVGTPDQLSAVFDLMAPN